jgi:hypothetical protein
MAYNDEQLKAIMRDVLLENIDKIAAAVTTKLKHKLNVGRDRSKFVFNTHRLEFVQKYPTLCKEAYPDHSNVWMSDHKKSAGKAIVALAREELGYKLTTYSGDIYRSIGITYFKSIGKWPK